LDAFVDGVDALLKGSHVVFQGFDTLLDLFVAATQQEGGQEQGSE
jgi:hypothetical protein